MRSPASIMDALISSSPTTRYLFRPISGRRRSFAWGGTVSLRERASGHRSLRSNVISRPITSAVPVLDGVQTIPDKRLAALGLTRRSSIRMPYFGAALECMPRTNLVLTATSGIAQIASKHPDLRVIEAPKELTGFSFQAVWHPRLSSDPAHTWLRQTIFRLSRDIAL